MNIGVMRRLVRDAYPGERWKDNVETMSNEQVIALYYKFLNQGKFNKKPEIVKPPVIKKPTDKTDPEWVQISMFDIF